MRVTSYARLSIGVVTVGIVAAIALWPSAVDVDVAPIARGPMRVTIDEDGETRVRDRFVISAPVTGRLERIDVEPGDHVRRGVVARLAPVDAPLLDARARAELRAASEAARQAVNQWIRTSKAYDGVIDFDALLRDANRPTKLQLPLAASDFIHPNDEGYRAVGNAVNLDLFKARPATASR